MKNRKIIEYVVSLIESRRLRGLDAVRIEYVQHNNPGIEKARKWSKKELPGLETGISEEDWFERVERISLRVMARNDVSLCLGDSELILPEKLTRKLE